jgi:signal transduction histidine kinase
VELPVLIDRTLSLIGYQLGSEGIRVKTVYDAAIPPLYLDETAFGQVILNLLLNARDAMRARSGELRVETALADGKEVLLRVSDAGTGIPPEVLPRIFDPFFTTKEAGEGTGLGLSLSLRTVTDHGGRIEVDTVVGEGTTFTVRLPLEQVRCRELKKS